MQCVMIDDDDEWAQMLRAKSYDNLRIHDERYPQRAQFSK